MVSRKQMWIGIVYIFISCHLMKQVQGKWPMGCEKAIIQDESCFITSEDIINYDNAAKICSQIGGTIAMMKNTLIQALIVTEFRRRNISVPFWAGITDISNEGTFRYHDGNSLRSFIPWAKNQPNNGGSSTYDEDCVAVDIDDEQWFDGDCTKYAYFACEFKRETNPCKIKNVIIPHAEYKSCYMEDQIPYGEILPIKCHEGYILIGPNNITCLADEKWSTQPQCVKGCPPPKQPAHAVLLNLSETYTLGSKVLYICNDGYVTTKEKRSHSQITCGPNSKWLPENNGCSLEEKYTIGIMEVEPRTSINLPCIVNNEKDGQMEHFFNNKTTYFWLKNSENITTTNMDFSIHENGTLLLNNMSEYTVGKYICFQVGQQIIPASVGFDLKLTSDACPQSVNKTNTMTFYEGSSAVFKCPHTSSDYEFTWFIDEQRYYIRDDQTMFPDGSLYTKTLKFSDQGIYNCQIRQKETLCERNHTTKVIIIATTDSICGNVDPKYPHPWVVSLWQKDEIAPFCYGTLIHESWVVTTAQCLAGLIRKRDLHIYVRFGYNERNAFRGNLTNNEVQIVKIHPKYSQRFHANDIGILQLKSPVHFTRCIRPICLTERDLTLKQPCEQFTLLKGTVVGWGPLEKDGYDVASVMNESMSIVMSQSNCFKGDQSHVENIMCSIKTPGTRTTFAGDTGSPMELLWKDQYHLLGIYSWGERAAQLGEHDYFTKINQYVSWLKSFHEK